jgi:DnaK suppressor protein
MEQAQREALKEVLKRLIEELARSAHSREEIAIENVPDALDLVQLAGQREMALRQVESEFSKLRSIRDALARFEDGSYGVCLDCDCEISINRLRAIPWAEYCVPCQEAADRKIREPEHAWTLPAA